MRTRTGNPFAEAHGRPMRCIDWLAPAGSTPETVRTAIEAAIGPLVEPVTGAVMGYINTSSPPGKPMYVSLQLYDFDCPDLACPAGHGGHTYRRAPALTGLPLEALQQLQAPGPELSEAILRSRFGPDDPPNRAV